MQFCNRKNYFISFNLIISFRFNIVTIQKTPFLWKPEIQLFRRFPELKMAYFNGKILSISL